MTWKIKMAQEIWPPRRGKLENPSKAWYGPRLLTKRREAARLQALQGGKDDKDAIPQGRGKV